MKERPILFSGPMVRAILDGSKTMTRRVVKPTKAHADGCIMLDYGRGWEPFNMFGDSEVDPNGMEFPIACPYGRPGDRLWVRETWAPVSPDEYPRPLKECNIEYRADNPDAIRAGDWDCEPDDPEAIRWRASIHMPRWASRITLEITDVRVERLQEISEGDALAEGCPDVGDRPGNGGPFDWYRALWGSLNAERGYGWDSTPWVWVVAFKKVTP